MTLIGYMRVSKLDGSQTTDLQRDALIKAGVDPDHLYEDKASGKKRRSTRISIVPESTSGRGYPVGVEA